MQEGFRHYNLTRELAKKHSHATYLASPIKEPECQVVLTVFASSLFHSPQERENFLQKAQRIQELQHPQMLPILDMGIEQEQPFVVRQYLPNGSLRSHLKKLCPDRMPLHDALTLVSQLGEAIAYVHEHHIVHGNIKPENILFDANDQPVLTDFSLVAKTDALIRDQATEEFAFCYMAPEQFSGTCDARSDQYALGCLTYELITGRISFATQSLASVMGRRSNVQPAPLSESVAGLAPSLETAVLKAIATDPDERFFDFSLFVEVIQSVLSPPPTFPFFAHPSHSGKKTMISHPAASAKAEIVLSSMRQHAAKGSRPEPPEQSGACFSAQVQGQQDEDSSVLTLETMSLAKSLTAEPAIATLMTEQESDDVLLFNLFEEQERLPGRADTSSTDSQSKAPAGKKGLSLTRRSTQRRGPMSVLARHSKRRGLELGLLFSVIVAVACSALWLSGIVIPEPHAHTPETNLRPTRKTIQTVARQTTPIARILPSAQAVITPATYPPSPATYPPSPMATPAPTTPTSYEAEASQNTLTGGAAVASCSECSGGYRVIRIGKNGMQFNNVLERNAGNYLLTIYYEDGKRTFYISVNGGTAKSLYVASGSEGTVSTISLTIALNAGANTIKFFNPVNLTPDIDRIVV